VQQRHQLEQSVAKIVSDISKNVFISEYVAQRLERQGLLMAKDRVDTTPLILNKWHLTIQNEMI